jgi:hypothetical protein
VPLEAPSEIFGSPLQIRTADRCVKELAFKTTEPDAASLTVYSDERFVRDEIENTTESDNSIESTKSIESDKSAESDRPPLTFNNNEICRELD